jgi:hypothetical protein
MMKTPTQRDLAHVIKHIKTYVPRANADAKDYCDPYDEGSVPSIQITIGWTPEDGTWSWQSGDNSYTGGAYGHPVWAIGYVTKRCNSTNLARDLIDQLWGQIP